MRINTPFKRTSPKFASYYYLFRFGVCFIIFLYLLQADNLTPTLTEIFADSITAIL